MPLSATVMVRAALSKVTRILSSPSLSNRAASVIASKRSLSHASEALEISSRRKISLLLYKEWIIRSSSCLTSAWKPSVSLVEVASLICLSPLFERLRDNRVQKAAFKTPPAH